MYSGDELYEDEITSGPIEPARVPSIAERRANEAARAAELRSAGKSLFEIASELGVSKEYLRERLGIR